MRRSWWAIASVALAMAAASVACGGDDDDNGEADVTEEATEPDSTTVEAEDSEGAGSIDISGVEELEDGVLDVLSDVPYAPIEFFDEDDNVVGVDPDMAAAIAEKLGVDYEFIPTGFDAIIPALNAGDGDAIMSAMTANEERDQEVDFVEYLNVGTGIAIQAGNPGGIEEFEDLCGQAVSVQALTIQEEQLAALNEGACAEDQIDIRSFPEQPLATQELADGNVDAMIADFPVVFEAAQDNEGTVEALDLQEEAAPYGIACRTESPLCEALQLAFDAIVEDGTYDQVLETWGLTAASIE
ncbi:MAG: transporter substrate-binding domain-containing protein [Dehalococcoidia bacterium]|nr:transporter substrate-binding domain-containing protein [Dehalococcoidia bacterium]